MSIETRRVAAILAFVALAATAAAADPVTRQTITGYAAGAAVQQGVPLEVPVREPLPSTTAADGYTPAYPGATAEVRPGEAPKAPTRKSMGLLGLSWTSN